MGGQAKRIFGTLLCLLSMSSLALGAFPNYSTSDRELETAAGYYDGNGKYQGGIPEVDGEELEFGVCVKPAHGTSPNGTSSSGEYNATSCSIWHEMKNVPEEEGEESLEPFRVCTCEALSDQDSCQTWTCSTVEVDPENTDCESTSLSDASRRRRLGTCFIELATASTRCRCDDENDRQFCAAWSCEQYLNEVVTRETYTCVKSSASNQYCQAWTGELESSERVDTKACECVEREFGSGICSSWDCKEKGIDTCERCNLTISIAAFGVVGLLGVISIAKSFMNKMYLSFCLFIALLWTIAAAGGAILYGGQDGGMYVAIMWAVFVILYCLCCRPHEE